MNRCGCLAVVTFSLTDFSSDLLQSADIHVLHLKPQAQKPFIHGVCHYCFSTTKRNQGELSKSPVADLPVTVTHPLGNY